LHAGRLIIQAMNNHTYCCRGNIFRIVNFVIIGLGFLSK